MIRFLVQAVRDNRGFTLLETVLAAGLAALVLLTAMEVSWRVWSLVGNSRKHFNEEAELRNAVYWVTRDLRRAEAVSEATTGKLALTVDGNTVVYILDSSSLVRSENDSKRTVAEGLAVADFSADEREGGALITAEFRGEKGGIRTCVWVYTGG